MNEADCEHRAERSADPFNASNQERTINEKGIC